MTTIDDQFRSAQRSSGPHYVPREHGDVGWRARRLIANAWRAFWLHDLLALEQWLTELGGQAHKDPMRRHMLAQHEALLSAALALARDDTASAVELARRVARGAQTEAMARVSCLLIRFGALRTRDWRHFDAAVCTGPWVPFDKRRIVTNILALCMDAAAETERSRLMVARRLASNALRIAERLQARMPFAIANAAAVMGRLLYEQGEVDEADSLLRRHLAQIARHGCQDAVEAAFVTLARIAFNRSQWKPVSQLLQELVVVGKARGWPRLVASGYAHEIDLQCCARDLARARIVMGHLRRLASTVVPPFAADAIACLEREAELRLRTLEVPTREAMLALERYLKQLTGQVEPLRRLRIGMQLVEVLSVLGEHAQAEAELVRCLRIGMKHGIFQSFFCASAIIREKLILVYNGSVLTRVEEAGLRAYLASLISREREDVVQERNLIMANKNTITTREREVLQQMSQGYSNKKIAKELGIGPETVKSHAKRIFFKLGVGSRVEAVSCANHLSLI